MLKQILSILLCICLVIGMLPYQAFAQETQDTEPAEEPVVETTEPAEEETDPTDGTTEPAEEVAAPSEETTEPAEKTTEPTEEATESEEEEPELLFLEAPGLDSEELLMGYLSPQYTDGGVSFFGTMARDRLSPANRHLYEGLVERIVQLANGEVRNTNIDVSFADTSYSVNDVDMTLVQEALMLDYPFEMYWYYGCYSGSGSNFFRVIMVPNTYYQAAGFHYQNAPYIDTDKTRKASAAAENIYTIKTRYEAYSDYDKLAAYVDEICSLVEYDEEAAKNSETLFLEDNRPWTLINVFDNDPSTNVVCEGYAEAFQYLCDESKFQGDVVCFSVTGDIPAGRHKWNIVRIDGVSYLMDVTNYDYNHITDRNFLFLSGGSGSVTAGYTVDGTRFVYHDETLAIYGSGEDSVLKLSPTKYTPPVTYTILYDANGGTGAPSSQKKTQGAYLILREGIPERPGYTFQGWASSQTATAAEYQPGDTYSAEGDAVLYAVWAEATSGTCGKNLTWIFDEEGGILTISGTGAMDNYESDTVPWNAYIGQIVSVDMDPNVTYIGSNAFAGSGLTGELMLPENLTAIGQYAFAGCTGMTGELVLPQQLKEIGNGAFTSCGGFTGDLVIPEGVTYIGNWAFMTTGFDGKLVLPETLTYIGMDAFLGCSLSGEVLIPEGISSISQRAFGECAYLTGVVLPQYTDSIGANAFGWCTGLEELTFTGDAPAAIAEDAFTMVTATAYYPAGNETWSSDVLQNYGGTINWIPYGGVKNQITIPAAELNGQASVWIDGKEYAVTMDSGVPYVDLPDSNAKTMVVHTYGTSKGKQYPNSMKVWVLENEDGLYTARRVKELDNILAYEGTSIRVTGNQGIRMITSLDKEDKTAMTGNGLAGYTLKEYGTAIAWASRISANKPLILGKSYVSSNFAYSREAGKDPVFATTEQRIQYTNVMVGFTLDQCKNDIAMRPYIILEDSQGVEITLYGGIVERSIGYIAVQNHDSFEEGTEANNYVWNIIKHVYGENYIPES